jgi:hypothetical protein
MEMIDLISKLAMRKTPSTNNAVPPRAPESEI